MRFYEMRTLKNQYFSKTELVLIKGKQRCGRKKSEEKHVELVLEKVIESGRLRKEIGLQKRFTSEKGEIFWYCPALYASQL